VEVILEVEKLRAIHFSEIVIKEGINILYGPNFGGKSTLIYALLSTMGITGEPLAGKLELDKGSRVGVSSSAGRVECSKGGCSCAVNGRTASGARINDILLCVRAFWENMGVRRVGYATTDTVAVYEIAGGLASIEAEGMEVKLELPMWSRSGWELLTRSPQVLSSDAMDDIRDLTDIGRLQAGYAVKQGKHIPLELLSYSEKKIVALMLVATHSDMLIVENYEAGLHVAQALRLLAKLNGTTKAVIVETHMGVLMVEGMELGWNVYYVEDGKALKLTRENMLNAEILRREVERYVRARPL